VATTAHHQLLGGTRAYQALFETYRRGALIAGTSAGASALSSTMIVGGQNNDQARKCTLKMAPGLGLLEQALIDQHFAQRGRLGRLLTGVAENPHALGIGIDEDTAIRIDPDARFFVLGSGAVTVIDGATIQDSNVSGLSRTDFGHSGCDAACAARGYGFDMKTRLVLPPEALTPPPALYSDTEVATLKSFRSTPFRGETSTA
jgi:cyanophycinase